MLPLAPAGAVADLIDSLMLLVHPFGLPVYVTAWQSAPFALGAQTRFMKTTTHFRNRMNPKVDGYLRKAKKWREEFEKLRRIILDCQLTEELKWGKPCYTFRKSNIVLIVGFKEYCALIFCKGALLNDANGILIKPGENTQAGRQIRFTAVREVVEMETIVKAYICEAIEAKKAGLKVDFKDNTELIFPEE